MAVAVVPALFSSDTLCLGGVCGGRVGEEGSLQLNAAAPGCCWCDKPLVGDDPRSCAAGVGDRERVDGLPVDGDGDLSRDGDVSPSSFTGTLRTLDTTNKQANKKCQFACKRDNNFITYINK